MDQEKASQYRAILLSELLPALGCTEPIAIALSAARGRDVLGSLPDRVDLYCSGSIIKNARTVVVPNSDGQKGIEIAVALGLFGGQAERALEVLADIAEDDRTRARQYVAEKRICIHLVKDEPNLYLRAELFAGSDHAITEIKYDHTHFNRIEKNGQVLHTANIHSIDDHALDLSVLNLRDIYEFACQAPLADEAYKELAETLRRQARFNVAIGEEGIRNAHGSEIGRTLLASNSRDSSLLRGIAYAAAGSDARMSGCSLPVVINSGSGNQGMTIATPLAIFAQARKLPESTLLRALALANLIAIHQKRFIGKLSAFCGVVSASAATGAGLAFLEGLSFDQIEKVIVNTLATSGGMICDGAKPSCAAKIGVALTTALMALDMARLDKTFHEGDGLVGRDAEQTIRNVGRLARVGMKVTDEEILHIMIDPWEEDESPERLSATPSSTP